MVNTASMYLGKLFFVLCDVVPRILQFFDRIFDKYFYTFVFFTPDNKKAVSSFNNCISSYVIIVQNGMYLFWIFVYIFQRTYNRAGFKKDYNSMKLRILTDHWGMYLNPLVNSKWITWHTSPSVYCIVHSGGYHKSWY